MAADKLALIAMSGKTALVLAQQHTLSALSVSPQCKKAP